MVRWVAWLNWPDCLAASSGAYRPPQDLMAGCNAHPQACNAVPASLSKSTHFTVHTLVVVHARMVCSPAYFPTAREYYVAGVLPVVWAQFFAATVIVEPFAEHRAARGP